MIVLMSIMWLFLHKGVIDVYYFEIMEFITDLHNWRNIQMTVFKVKIMTRL